MSSMIPDCTSNDITPEHVLNYLNLSVDMFAEDKQKEIKQKIAGIVKTARGGLSQLPGSYGDVLNELSNAIEKDVRYLIAKNLPFVSKNENTYHSLQKSSEKIQRTVFGSKPKYVYVANDGEHKMICTDSRWLRATSAMETPAGFMPFSSDIDYRCAADNTTHRCSASVPNPLNHLDDPTVCEKFPEWLSKSGLK